MSDFTSPVNHQLAIYLFNQDNTVSPNCQSIVLLPLLPLTLIVHREKKKQCPLPLQLSTDSHFVTGHVLHSGKCCTGCQERVTPAGWS